MLKKYVFMSVGHSANEPVSLYYYRAGVTSRRSPLPRLTHAYAHSARLRVDNKLR